MDRLKYDDLRRLRARALNRLFILYAVIQSHIRCNRKLKILFSKKPEWEGRIKKGFRFTRHEIAFDDFSPDKLNEYDLVVPLTIDDSIYLNQHYHFVRDNPIPIPNTQSILICDNKRILNNALITKGFGHLIPQLGGKLVFPYILKKKTDEWGAHSYVICDTQQERSLADLRAHPDYFTQEMITGKHEYCTHILFKDQTIVSALTIKYTFKTDVPIKGKDEPICTCVTSCEYIDTFSSILKSIDFEGLCNINYKISDGRLFILEINPRFGGSLSPFFVFFLTHLK